MGFTVDRQLEGHVRKFKGTPRGMCTNVLQVGLVQLPLSLFWFCLRDCLLTIHGRCASACRIEMHCDTQTQRQTLRQVLGTEMTLHRVHLVLYAAIYFPPVG